MLRATFLACGIAASLALAVSSASRSDALPDIPPVGDFLPGYEATGWFGIGVPRSTPAEIIDKTNYKAWLVPVEQRTCPEWTELAR